MTEITSQSDSRQMQGDVAGVLEEEIVLGLLNPRERLVEDSLMERFGVKRHVVRKALVDLEASGVVERKPNVGAFVKAFSEREVIELYSVRELLETHAAAVIPLPADPNGLAALIEIQTSHDRAVETNDPRAAYRANFLFHRTLFELTDNSVLAEAIRLHAQRAHVIRSITAMSHEHLDRSRREHWLIIDALRNLDRMALVEMCRVHLLPSRDAYLKRVNVALHQ